MPDSNPGPMPQKSGVLPMSHHIHEAISTKAGILVLDMRAEHSIGNGENSSGLENLTPGKGIQFNHLIEPYTLIGVAGKLDCDWLKEVINVI